MALLNSTNSINVQKKVVWQGTEIATSPSVADCCLDLASSYVLDSNPCGKCSRTATHQHLTMSHAVEKLFATIGFHAFRPTHPSYQQT